jgi:hypothetical protein
MKSSGCGMLRGSTATVLTKLKLRPGQLRVKLALLAELLQPGLDEAPDGSASLVRAARQILGSKQVSVA